MHVLSCATAGAMTRVVVTGEMRHQRRARHPDEVGQRDEQHFKVRLGKLVKV